ncbi:MAG: cation transporter [Rikenellaceae bacterium]|jgi:Co/Zn/Cd efflux system component|nr:cation transporter [Rikenellaceae bacterium]
MESGKHSCSCGCGAPPPAATPTEQALQRRVLWIVLAVNFGGFLMEMTAGLLAGSMSLWADSLDMFSDAAIYGMSLWAVGAAVTRQKRVALLSGVSQVVLAVAGLAEVLRRVFGGEQAPEFCTMIIVSIIALIANAFTLRLLHRARSGEAHIRASIICTSNDVIANAGVIVAGLAVWLLESKIPDLVVGVVIFILVIRGALRTLRLAK